MLRVMQVRENLLSRTRCSPLHSGIDVSSKKRNMWQQENIESSSSVMLEKHAEAKGFADCIRQIIDRHALLIMRELSMNVRRFRDIEAQTKIGSALLTSRLRRLERDGIIERRLYSEHPPRYEYFATAKGKDLDAVLFAAGNWNIMWGDLLDPSLTIFDKGTGQRLSAFPRSDRKSSPKSNS